MHSGSMSLLGYPGLCSATSHSTHCYVPVTTPVALCSNDVNSTFGHYLPSSYQGNLWLLDHCQESYCEVPSCESPSCEPKTCTADCGSTNSCVPCNSPSTGQVVRACEPTNIKSGTSCSPCTWNKGYVSKCHTPTPCLSRACQTLPNGSNCFGQLNYLPKNFHPLISHCRPGCLGYRSYQDFGFISSGSSPSCYIASSYQPQSYLIRNCQYSNYGPVSCRPLSYLSRNFRSLSCIPSTFPPLRYLCSGSRPLNCY
ncbi:Keratin-associated protein 24-1 [Sciurus carolinensis]|uniref:Keratin-associated protein n=1 Tax=Sciurus carolinensis TaxID=30640 RepID=A0AA41N8E9_SCICA|nr:keratin-associated protein 24-1 [Sciurus carolinensis]MBZ3885709.1 Keratin-associated protein 24-1 [Sciurus carolinensis]